jgi:8-oxo-dGTP diphosphatase
MPSGLEGQALAWAPLHKLADYPMPPADGPAVALLMRELA